MAAASVLLSAQNIMATIGQSQLQPLAPMDEDVDVAEAAAAEDATMTNQTSANMTDVQFLAILSLIDQRE